MTDVTKGVSKGLHALAVVGNGGITLGNGVELMADEDRPGLLVAAELPLDGKPKLPGRRLLTSMANSRTESSTELNIQERTQQSA
jgi:hypothetical protein